MASSVSSPMNLLRAGRGVKGENGESGAFMFLTVLVILDTMVAREHPMRYILNNQPYPRMDLFSQTVRSTPGAADSFSARME